MAFYDWNLARKLSPTAQKLARVAQLRAYHRVKKYLNLRSNANLQVLEIGVGKGFFAEICLNEGFIFQGIEPNEQAVKILNTKGVTVIQGFAPPLPFESEKFDLVYSSHVIEHLENHKEAVKFVEEISRVIRKNGIIVLLFPDFLRVGKEFWNIDYTHNFVTSRRRIQQMLDDCGISTIETVPQSGHIFGRVSYLISFLLKFYPYYLLQRIFDSWIDPEVFYRPRRALAEGILLIAKKRI